jgi:muramidase (phage lysozyme)
MPLPAITDNERRLLGVIRHAEGTAGADGYSTTFGYQHFDPSKGHPRRVVRSGGYASDAAGAYQFLSTTWDRAAKGAGVDPRVMSQDNQDRAALWLVRQRGVDPTKPITPEAIAKLSPEWASLPTASGKSYYGQPVKAYGDLQKVYGGSLPNPGNGGGGGAPATAGGVDLASMAGGGGGSLLPAAPAFDLSGVIASLNEETTPFQSTQKQGTNPVMAVLGQTLEEINKPLPSIRPRQADVVAPTRMAASRGFMQPLLALTQRPGSLVT